MPYESVDENNPLASDSDNFCKKTLFYWSINGNKWLQLSLVVLVLLVVIARVVPLEMQKRIINDSITLQKYENLFLYCGIYLLAILCSSLLKFSINTLQAIIGERAMSAMRKALFSHIISLPLSFFRNTQPGFVVSTLMTELSTVGSFAGMAIAVPLTNILTLVVLSGYLLWLNTTLALATLAIYPVVIFVIPLLQKKANTANKERVDISRQTSGIIAESISGINEIHAHGSFQREEGKFGLLIAQLKKIRTRWSLLRFGIKSTNNFFVSLGPFIVFLLGGYLAIEGDLALGSLVAFLSAQEKLYDPWKELIGYYQLHQDAKVRHKKTIDHFNLPSEITLPDNGVPPSKFTGKLSIRNLSYRTDTGNQLLKNITFNLNQYDHLALIGFSGSGKSTLAKCIGNLHKYTDGSILIDGRELNQLRKSYIVENIGFVTQTPFIFTGSIEENLLYAYRAKIPPDQAITLSLDDKIEALQNAGFFVDVLRFGLETVLAPDETEMRGKIIRMRRNFHGSSLQELSALIELYQHDTEYMDSSYLDDKPIINNIFYGQILSTRLEDQEKINQAVVQLLIEEDCLEIVAELGLRYDVGSEGNKLSGGQRQKLAIARVILKRPNFIILDEATSALDNKSQMRIERLRKAKWQGKISVVAVVHRLDMIDTYDKIAVMKDGRIVEFGGYDELISKQGYLKQLIEESQKQ